RGVPARGGGRTARTLRGQGPGDPWAVGPPLRPRPCPDLERATGDGAVQLCRSHAPRLYLAAPSALYPPGLGRLRGPVGSPAAVLRAPVAGPRGFPPPPAGRGRPRVAGRRGGGGGARGEGGGRVPLPPARGGPPGLSCRRGQGEAAPRREGGTKH